MPQNQPEAPAGVPAFASTSLAVDIARDDVENFKEPRHSTASVSLADDESVNSSVPVGVQKMQAATSVWTKSHLFSAYFLILLIVFCNSLQSTIFGTLTPYVTSSFEAHSLTATTSIMSNIIGGLSQLPLAKVLDLWGRAQGFALVVGCYTIGVLMMAACNNVKTYAAAQVFYGVGSVGINYAITIFIADTSHLKNRGLMLGLTSTPYLVTTWIGGPAAQSILNHLGFRWGFGIFAIIEPLLALPLWALFHWNYIKAKKAGLITPRKSNRTLLQSLKYYAIEFDVVGLLVLATGISLFLLAFALYSYQAEGFRAPMIISFLVIGALLIVAFPFYERYLAPKTFLPWHYLVDRTVLGAYIFSAVIFIEFYIWDSYFYSFLIVVQNLSITNATYVTQIYTMGSCSFCLLIGFAIRYTGRFKWIALYFGTPITMLGVGLMIAFRQPHSHIGYIVMCQIFIAFGGAACVICEQIAVMAVVGQEHVAAVLACEAMFTYIGGAVGLAVASAIWTGVFPDRLARYLPAAEQGNLSTIYGSLEVQSSYPRGSPARDAIERAYGDAQRAMLIGSCGVLIIALIAVACWQDIKVKDLKQVKGRVV